MSSPSSNRANSKLPSAKRYSIFGSALFRNEIGPQKTEAKSKDMIKVGGEMVSITLFVENPGLDRAHRVGSGRLCGKNNSSHNVKKCDYLHQKERHSQNLKTNEDTINILFELMDSSNPTEVVLGDGKKMICFQNLLRMPTMARRLIPVVYKMISPFFNNEDCSADAIELRLWCDAFAIRSVDDIKEIREWNSNEQERLFDLIYDLCRRDPVSLDNRRALDQILTLPGLTEEMRRKGVLVLSDTEPMVVERQKQENANEIEIDGEEEGNAKKTKRYIVCQMYDDRLPATSNVNVLPHTLADLRAGYEELKDLPGVVVDRFIPHDLRSLHLRLLFHLSRADCMHGLSKAVQRFQEKGEGALRRQDQIKTGQKIQSVKVIFNKIISNIFHGVLASFYLSFGKKGYKIKLLQGDLVLIWPHSKPLLASNSFFGVVKESQEKEFEVSIVDVINQLPLLNHGGEFILIRCESFYLPTAASLEALRNHEKKILDNKEPILLRAFLTGEGTTDTPIYLQNNPLLQVGECVALAPGNMDQQPALNNWQSENWTEELEKKIRLNSGGKKALLDPTQLDALQHIFRNQVAIIQGTPGTGKSFVGSKLIQLLLQNKKNLKIGPIIVMTYTHHALESVFDNFLPLINTEEINVGILGRANNENLKWYEICPRRSRRTKCEYFVDAAKKINRLQQCTSIYFDIERDILSVVNAHHGSTLGERCMRFYNDVKKVKDDCLKKREQIKNELYWTPPNSLKDLVFIANKLKNGKWFDVVNVVPYLGNKCGDKKDLFLTQTEALFNEAEECKMNGNLDDDTILYFQEWLTFILKCLLRVASKRLLKQTISIFSQRINELLELEKRERSLNDVTFLEYWRTEEVGNFPLPPIDEVILREGENHEFDNTTKEATFLENFEAEAAEEQRRQREIDHNEDEEEIEELQGAKVSLISIPPKEERRKRMTEVIERLDKVEPGVERSNLLRLIILEKIYCLQEELNEILAQMEKQHKELEERDCWRLANDLVAYDVIGATSTKMMTLVNSIQKCGASVLIIEEAAELLESHVLACITESMQHVVLIGDHKQLRPKVNEFELERNHNMAISAMERLVLCGLPCVTLTMQRRMTPEISELTKSYYKRSHIAGEHSVNIEDHPRTRYILPPFGVCRPDGTPYRLYFIDHDGKGPKQELMCEDMMSPQNPFEAQLVACIAHYLLNRNDKMGITILVPYNGQQFALFKELGKMNVPRRTKYGGEKGGVRLSTIDDYQGEEDDIIILSLVRTLKPGFLRLENRSCVALSRARSALYVIGCSSLLSGACSLWANLKQVCLRDGCFGTRFPARCDFHSQHDLSFSNAQEYQAKRARCPEKCESKLLCGHTCKGSCHGRLPHPKCTYPCERTGKECNPPRLYCNHPCLKICGNSCSECTKDVTYTYKECGHTVTLKCHQMENIPKCTEIFKKEALCGHQVEATCTEHKNEKAHLKCKEKCGIHMSCGHVCRKHCHYSKDDSHQEGVLQCTLPRTSKASCGHEINHPCNQKYIDSLCKSSCGKRVSSCRQGNFCKRNCGHTGPCDCKEVITVKLSCGHESPEFKCSNTDLPLCTAVCGTTLPCGHQCSGNCGLCSQRKFHSGCKVEGKVLVCGHRSKLGCTAEVDLCEEPCSFGCDHGNPCKDLSNLHTCSSGCPTKFCQESCEWKCEHGSCSLSCYEPCKFEGAEGGGCWKRCNKLLSCEHQCCGLCGEKCPQFCWICYAEKKPNAVLLADKVQTFIGDIDDVRLGKPMEDNEDPPCLIELPCCHTFLPARELYNILNAKDRQCIRVHTCPLCRAIMMPMSFRHGGNLIKRQILLAEEVAKRCREKIEAQKKEAEHRVDDILKFLYEKGVVFNLSELQKFLKETRKLLEEYKNLKKRKDKSNPSKSGHDMSEISQIFWSRCREMLREPKWIPLLFYHLHVVEFAISGQRKDDKAIVRNAEKLSRAAFEFIRFYNPNFIRVNKTNDLLTQRIINFLQKNISELVRNPDNLVASLPSTQASGDVEKFVQRVKWTEILFDLIQGGYFSSNISNNVEAAMWFSERGVGPDEKDKAIQVEYALSRESQLKERRNFLREINRAIGLTAGNWFTCPKGHIYAIGGCGGAMEEAKCPECGNTIGGTSLRLQQGNHSARNLFEEGARPSWPTVLMRGAP